MSHADFVHLHVHTEYSLLDGACRLDRLMARARDLKFPALAITDHGYLYGAIDFYKTAVEHGIKPIIGCEVYVAPGSRHDKKTSSGGRDVYHHLVLLAKNLTGYKNLVKLVTLAALEGYYYKPRIDKELLAANHEGLIALSGCLASEVPEMIIRDQLGKARDAIDWFKHTLGPENFFLELQNHTIAEQTKVNRQLIQWAPEFGLKLVATNDVHYVEKEHWQAHDCLICIGTQSQLNDEKRMRYEPAQFYLRSADEMKALFHEVPDAVKNTLEVAEMCGVEIKFGKLHYPNFHPPPEMTRAQCLQALVAEGLQHRYGMKVLSLSPSEGERAGERGPHLASNAQGDFVVESIADARRLPTFIQAKDAPNEPVTNLSAPEVTMAVEIVMERVRMELKVIEKTGFIDYFLIVGDFVRYGRSQGISCVARGSAAGSIVTYLLEISNIDPIRYGLLFERFLNPERISPPDIDIDFADDRRADVIEYVRKKYGNESVAQIVTFGTMGAKSVVRDVGRVMGLSYGESDRLAKMIPFDLKMTLEKALKQSPELKGAYANEEQTKKLIDTAMILEDLTRNASVHAAGVVIGGEPLINLLPLKKDENGAIVTQYAMGPVGELGLLKMDFLGLKTLTVIRNACEMIRLGKGITVDTDNLPLEDAKTYDLLNRAQTLGVFQLESGGMRDLCRKFQISSVDHITALIALYRPGPMDLIPDYLKRRHGEVKIEYEHPLLEPICRESYGIMIYQEQVMQATQVLAGFTLGGADLLRRAMGKKNVAEMASQRAAFVKGCEQTNKIPAGKANQIFDLLEKFAGYGFNKSHAAAYAVVAYQTAWLKANYPVEFLCAMLTNDMDNTDKLAAFIAEARAMGIEVLPPDVNESRVAFTPAREGTVIRFGLAAIKGVGEAAVQSILSARESGGKFLSLANLCERVESRSVSKKVLEALIKTGACDSFGETRATLFSRIDHEMSRAASAARDKASGQGSLFGALSDATPAAAVSAGPKLPEWEQHVLLAAEKELLGFYVTGHPLSPFAPILESYSLGATDTIGKLPTRTMTRIGGMVEAVQTGFSKKNQKPYAMLTLEDLRGSVQVLCMNDNYERFKQLLVPGKALMVVGEVNTEEDKPKIFPQDIFPLEDAPRRFTKQVHLRLHTVHLTDESLEKIRNLAGANKGKCPLFLCLMKPSGEIIFIQTHEHFAVTPGLALQQQVNALFGDDAYYAKADTALPERERRAWERRESSNGGE